MSETVMLRVGTLPSAGPATGVAPKFLSALPTNITVHIPNHEIFLTRDLVYFGTCVVLGVVGVLNTSMKRLAHSLTSENLKMRPAAEEQA